MHQKIEKHLTKKNLIEHCHKNSKIYEKVYRECLNLSGENLLIIGDHGFSNRNASSMLSYMNYLASQNQGLKSKVVWQKPKNRVSQADTEIIRALKALPKKSVIFTNISHRLGKLDGLGNSFRKFCKKQGHRFISSTSLAGIYNSDYKKLMNTLDVDYKRLSKRHDKLKKKMDNAKEVQVTTKKGTDLFIDIDNIESKKADGIYLEPGTGGNLPSGEVYVAPRNRQAFGKVVLDVSIKTISGTIPVNQPVSLYVENGDVKYIRGGYEARALQKSLDWAFKTANTTWGLKRIGELGIGLNDRAKPVGSTLIDEKVLGTAHVAIGSNYWFGGSVKSKIHLDHVFSKPEIRLDGRKINY
ncbi:MAG: aminopeptidase [Candidatus Woesearchaeota archaeon]